MIDDTVTHKGILPVVVSVWSGGTSLYVVGYLINYIRHALLNRNSSRENRSLVSGPRGVCGQSEPQVSRLDPMTKAILVTPIN